MWLFCLLDPGQIRYRAIYTHPNQIPGYASDRHSPDAQSSTQHETSTTNSRLSSPVGYRGRFRTVSRSQLPASKNHYINVEFESTDVGLHCLAVVGKRAFPVYGANL